MRRRFWLFPICLIPIPLAAHMVSLSTGELRIEGRQARYELRMPLYEMTHMKDPQRTLFEHIRFASSGGEARLGKHSCREDAADGAYSCEAAYEFPDEVARLSVECRFPSITVPNHVHVLRAARGERADQAVLDLSFPKADLRFEPPTGAEVALQELGAGISRAVGGLAPLLFLVSLVLASRTRRELALLAGMFLVGEIGACIIVSNLAWQPAPRFVEAAAALTIAYLAVEILLLPEAGQRWLVVGVLGGFHGLYFALFLKNSGYSAGYFLAGVAAAELTALAVLALALSRLRNMAAALRPVQSSASVLFVVGMAWFFLRLRG